MGTPLWAMGLFVFVSVLSAVATLFLKLAAPEVSLHLKRLVRNWKLFFGIFLYGLATLLSLAALKAGELSVLYPFVALQYVWTAFLSMRYVGEKMSFMKWAGIALIFIGVSLVGIGA